MGTTVARFGILALLGSLGGCVARTQYIESLNALTAERSYRQTAESRAVALEQQLTSVRSELNRSQTQSQSQAQEVERLVRERDQSAFEITVAQKAREDAAQLVDQLRDELARVAEHLRAYSDQKQALGDALKVADAKAAELIRLEATARERALLLRDLALALHDPVASGDVELSVEDGQAVLKVPARFLFKDSELASSALPILSAVARVAGIHRGSRLEVVEAGKAAGAQRRLQQLASGLAARGMEKSQIVLGTPATGAAAPLPGEERVEFRLAAAS